MTSAATTDVPHLGVDPFAMDFFADPFPTHALMRDTGPVVYLDKWSLYGVARYAEVYAVLNDPADLLFQPRRGSQRFRQGEAVASGEPDPGGRSAGAYAHAGGAERCPVADRLRKVRAHFAEVAEAKVDELLARGSFDAITDLAEAYPLSVFPDAMGLKKEGRENLLPYASLVFNAFGPPNELRAQAIARSAPHQSYVAEQCQRANLAPEGFGGCIHAHVDTGAITETEAPLLVRSLLSAGIDTTVNGIGAALYCLARFPDQFARLRADPTLARNAFEEAIRFESPVQTFFRTTTREVELAGHRIGEGEKVLMFLGSANRDPRRWENADRYDVARRTAGHVGYGSGIHMCVGQLVARVEGEVMLAALARKVGKIEITGEPKRLYNNTLRGLESLPIRISAA